MKKRMKLTMMTAVCVMLLLPATTAYAANYTVVTNDSVYKISQLFKVPTDTIIQDNSLSNADSINPGQILYVSALEYKVKSGDTLTKIANNYKVTLTNLRKANHISGSIIKVGQKLIIPGVKPAGGTATGTGSNGTSSGATNGTGTGTSSGATTGTGAGANNGSVAVIPYSNSEVDLLARLIEAEASGESYQAKVAVGGVVINRVQSGEWASTITDVVYQKYEQYYQFTPVENGMINKPASGDSVKAAWAALDGSDPSNGGIYYYDGSTTNQWITSKTVTAQIGNLTFVK